MCGVTAFDLLWLLSSLELLLFSLHLVFLARRDTSALHELRHLIDDCLLICIALLEFVHIFLTHLVVVHDAQRVVDAYYAAGLLLLCQWCVPRLVNVLAWHVFQLRAVFSHILTIFVVLDEERLRRVHAEVLIKESTA